jgi:hypothetical protein
MLFKTNVNEYQHVHQLNSGGNLQQCIWRSICILFDGGTNIQEIKFIGSVHCRLIL